MQRAGARPSVGMAELSSQAARHQAEQAALPGHNPELSAAAGPRFAGDDRSLAFQLGVAQTFELGGKRQARRAVATAKIAAAEAERLDVALHARLDAWRAFQLALVSRERVAMMREGEQVAIQVEGATKERQQVGFGTQLELNLTTAEVGRARHDRLDAERKYDASIAALADAIGAAAAEVPEPLGELVPPPVLAAGAEALLARALRERPEALAVRAAAELARAEVRAADAAAAPDLSLGISYAYERDPELTAQTVLATAAIGLPLWSRNQGSRRASRALARRAELERGWTATAIERDVRLAVVAYQRAREAVLGFDREVNERLHENLELARASYASGKIDYFQFNLVRRELLASRTAYLDAFEETVEAWSAVQRAIGGEVTP